MKATAVISAKGGVGKTTCAQGLALALVRNKKQRVLLIDADWQGDLTAIFGIGKETFSKGMHTVLTGETPLMEAVYETDVEGLNIVPADPRLRPIIKEFNKDDNTQRLIEILSGAEGYDHIIFDCSPVLDTLGENIVSIGDIRIIVPVLPEPLSLNGIETLLETLGEYDPEFIGGRTKILVNRVNAAMTKSLEAFFEDTQPIEQLFFANYVSQDATILKAQRAGIPTRRGGRSYMDFLQISKEVLLW